MPLRAEYTLHQSDLNDFLSAPVWEERNGIQLSVLSALARLDIDPWAEAARLAALPKGAAASALALLLRRLPGQHPDTADAVTTADRLVTLLPQGGSATTTTDGDAGVRGGRTSIIPGPWLVLAIMATLAALALNGLWS